MPEDVDWYRPRAKTPISPFELNNEGRGQALVLRYAGCNLRCSLCYAWKYAWLPKTEGHQYGIEVSIAALNDLPKIVEKGIVWVRIQGGEPCLNYDRTLHTLNLARHALRVIHLQGLNYFDDTRAVIQTNGMAFGNLTAAQTDDIRNSLASFLRGLPRGRIIFELSFKSPNEQPTLKRQLTGYDVLLNGIVAPLWDLGLANIAVYPIAGLGPSVDLDNVWLVPIDPSSLRREKPLFHRSTWAPSFGHVPEDFFENVVPNYPAYNSFRSNRRTGNGTRMALEELEPALFQTSWISGYGGRYGEFNMEVTPVGDILRRMSDSPDPQWYALFKRHASWLDVLDEIPVASDTSQLLDAVKDMGSYFYPSHPIGHYPHL